MVKQLETNVDDVNFFKTTRHMKYRMKPVSATLCLLPSIRERESKGALITHLSIMSTSVIS